MPKIAKGVWDERSPRNRTEGVQRQLRLHGADVIRAERPHCKWRLKCLVGRDRSGKRQVNAKRTESQRDVVVRDAGG